MQTEDQEIVRAAREGRPLTPEQRERLHAAADEQWTSLQDWISAVAEAMRDADRSLRPLERGQYATAIASVRTVFRENAKQSADMLDFVSRLRAAYQQK